MLKGSCLCGAVTYQLNQTIERLVFCHCNKCRKANGSAFNSVSLIDTDKFTLLTGQDQLKSFNSSPGAHRFFCGDCGSPLYSARDQQPETLRLRIGTLDSPIAPDKKVHIFVDSKAEWEELCDNNPKFAELPSA